MMDVSGLQTFVGALQRSVYQLSEETERGKAHLYWRVFHNIDLEIIEIIYTITSSATHHPPRVCGAPLAFSVFPLVPILTDICIGSYVATYTTVQC